MSCLLMYVLTRKIYMENRQLEEDLKEISGCKDTLIFQVDKKEKMVYDNKVHKNEFCI